MSTALQRLNRPVIAILAVTAIAGALRFTHLSRPPELFFDENYYAKAGCILIGGSDHVCRVDSGDEHYWREHKWDVGSWVHPPLGKWTIGMGEKLFGVTPFGWRFSSAVAGTLIVTFVAVIAQLLFGSPLWTFVAGTVARRREPQRRAVAIGAARHPSGVLGGRGVPVPPVGSAMDRPAHAAGARAGAGTRLRRRTGDTPEIELMDIVRSRSTVPFPLWRPWRFAAGIALGASFSVKWSGGMAILGALILSVAWETTRRHAAAPPADGRWLGRSARRASASSSRS